MNFNKNRRIKVILISGLLGILIVPQVAFASWWNPFSWDIFSFFQKTSPQEQAATSSTPYGTLMSSSSRESADVKKIILASPNPTSSPEVIEHTQPKQRTPVTVSAPTEIQVQTPSLAPPTTDVSIIQPAAPIAQTPRTKICPNGEVILEKLQCSTSVVTPVAPAPVVPNGTLCNGAYYSSCTAGNDLVCPSSGGKAYCQLQYQTPSPQVPPSAPIPAPVPSPSPTPQTPPIQVVPSLSVERSNLNTYSRHITTDYFGTLAAFNFKAVGHDYAIKDVTVCLTSGDKNDSKAIDRLVPPMTGINISFDPTSFNDSPCVVLGNYYTRYVGYVGQGKTSLLHIFPVLKSFSGTANISLTLKSYHYIDEGETPDPSGSLPVHNATVSIDAILDGSLYVDGVSQ